MTERMAWYNEWKNSLREVLRMKTDVQRYFLDDSAKKHRSYYHHIIIIIIIII